MAMGKCSLHVLSPLKTFLCAPFPEECESVISRLSPATTMAETREYFLSSFSGSTALLCLLFVISANAGLEPGLWGSDAPFIPLMLGAALGVLTRAESAARDPLPSRDQGTD